MRVWDIIPYSQLVETMPQTKQVEEFLISIGPFYEIVEDEEQEEEKCRSGAEEEKEEKEKEEEKEEEEESDEATFHDSFAELPSPEVCLSVCLSVCLQ